MFSTYQPEDVTILLKDITGLVKPLGTSEREAAIQRGVHYSEMLPLEYRPSQAYMAIYEQALQMYSQITADAVAVVAERIWNDKNGDLALISLARAGTSIGVLIKRYLQSKYCKDIKHYTISIIRGKGIDKNAMNHILEIHSPGSIQFVDGWTGKGAIQNELRIAMKDFPGVSPGVAVLSDPAYIAEKCGTHDDFLIASSCLNSVVSGLMSRTFFRTDIIGENDYHGAAFYKDLMAEDRTYEFIDAIEKCFRFDLDWRVDQQSGKTGMEEVLKICQEFDIQDINFVKPSIGEATRVLLRRLPWKVLVHSLNDNEHLGHLYQLAKEKGVEVIEYPLVNYRACGLIKRIADA